MTTESAIGGCFACEGLPVAPNDPCGMCGRSSKDFKPVKLRGSTTRTTENKGLVERIAARIDSLRPHPVTVELAEALDRIRELETDREERNRFAATIVTLAKRAGEESARADAAEARSRKLEEALDRAGAFFVAHLRPEKCVVFSDGKSVSARTMLADMRALLDQADGEEG